MVRNTRQIRAAVLVSKYFIASCSTYVYIQLPLVTKMKANIRTNPL